MARLVAKPSLIGLRNDCRPGIRAARPQKVIVAIGGGEIRTRGNGILIAPSKLACFPDHVKFCRAFFTHPEQEVGVGHKSCDTDGTPDKLHIRSLASWKQDSESD